MHGQSPQKILIVRFSSIGDIVLTFPVVKAIKAAFPECQVDYVSKKQFAELLKACPEINRAFLLERSLSRLRQQIDLKQYDAIIDLHHNLRTRLLLFASGAPVFRFPKSNWQKWLLTKFKVRPKKRTHVVERYLSTIQKFTPNATPLASFVYAIPSSAQFNIDERFQVRPKSYIAVAIGAQFATKRMPKDLLVELLNQLHEPVLLLGGKEDVATATFILEQTNSEKVYSAVGLTNIHESAWLVQNAKSLLTHDTGLMHIGASFDLPIHLLWGNTTKDFGMYPYRLEQKNVFHHEVANLACRPCSKIGYNDCPKGHFNCMRQRDLKQIISAINQ